MATGSSHLQNEQSIAAAAARVPKRRAGKGRRCGAAAVDATPFFLRRNKARFRFWAAGWLLRSDRGARSQRPRAAPHKPASRRCRLPRGRDRETLQQQQGSFGENEEDAPAQRSGPSHRQHGRSVGVYCRLARLPAGEKGWEREIAVVIIRNRSLSFPVWRDEKRESARASTRNGQKTGARKRASVAPTLLHHLPA